jgi:hypothetical protein
MAEKEDVMNESQARATQGLLDFSHAVSDGKLGAFDLVEAIGGVVRSGQWDVGLHLEMARRAFAIVVKEERTRQSSSPS